MGIRRYHVERSAVHLESRKASLSAEQIGNATEQSVAHGLGVTPTLVIINITGSPAGYAALVVTEGTHDATYVKVNVTTGWKYKVYAEA